MKKYLLSARTTSYERFMFEVQVRWEVVPRLGALFKSFGHETAT